MNRVKLSEVLTHRKEFITIDNSVEYMRCRVQVNRKGVVLRDIVRGSAINTKKQQVCKTGDFLVAEIDAKVGGYGFVPAELEGAIVSSHYFLFEVDESKMLKSYLAWLIKTEIIQDQITSKGSTNYAAIRPSHVLNFEIPLPKLGEQKILVDRLNNIYGEFFNLEKEFVNQQNYLNQLRQAILQEAVQGKLSKQDPNDEPAEKLLTRIKTEKQKHIKEGKLKKEKELPPIAQDAIPSELPRGWAWCRLEDIISFMDAGWSPACKEEPAQEAQWGVLKTTAVQEMEFLQFENKALPDSLIPKTRFQVQKGDILITRAGPQNRVGICCLVENVRDKLMISDKIIRFHLWERYLDPKFITMCLNTGVSKQHIENKKSGMAASQVNISQDNLKLTPIPIPPFTEQRIIVEKVDKLLRQANDLGSQITTNNGCVQRLLQAVLKETFEGKQENVQNELNETIKIAAEAEVAYLGASATKKYNNFPEVQAVWYWLRAKSKQINPIYYGQMALAKELYLVDRLYEVKTGFNFVNWHWGPYDPKMKEIVFAKTKYFIQQGTQGRQTINIDTSKAEKIEKYNFPYKNEMETAATELHSLFGKYPAKERTHKIELLATVAKCIEDKKSTELSAIRSAMASWPINDKSVSFKNKAEKFTEKETSDCIKFIINKGWHRKLIDRVAA